MNDHPSLVPKQAASKHLFANDVQAYAHGPISSKLLLASKPDDLSHDTSPLDVCLQTDTPLTLLGLS